MRRLSMKDPTLDDIDDLIVSYLNENTNVAPQKIKAGLRKDTGGRYATSYAWMMRRDAIKRMQDLESRLDEIGDEMTNIAEDELDYVVGKILYEVTGRAEGNN